LAVEEKTVLWLERIAEERINAAIQCGEFDDLPGKGSPIAEEHGWQLIAPELRMAYRLLKTAGYVPEEVALLREIQEVQTLIRVCTKPDQENPLRRRLTILLQRLGDTCGGNLLVQEDYCRRIAERLGSAGSER
jgi:hypothetical protein